MSVAEHVRTSLNHWSAQRWAPAVAEAGDAVAQTAAKRYPTLGVAGRFKRTMRDGMDIFGAMAAGDIDFESSRFPLPVQTDLPDGRPDAADVLFAVHRHLGGHPEELSGGCEITPHADGVPMFNISGGHLRLRGSAALGLLAIAVFAPENRGEVIGPSYTLGWQQHVFHLAGWWGWQDHFRDIISNARVERYALKFGPEWEHWRPVR